MKSTSEEQSVPVIGACEAESQLNATVKQIWRRYHGLCFILWGLGLTLLVGNLQAQLRPVRVSRVDGFITRVSAQARGMSVTVSMEKPLSPVEPSSVPLFRDLAASGSITAVDLVPRRIIRLVIPPATTVRIASATPFFSPLEEPSFAVASRSSSPNDTTALSPIYRSITAADLSGASVPVEVEGYEWFRGYSLVRLAISQITSANGELVSVDSLRLDLSFQSADAGASLKPSTPDPQFRQITQRLVANPDMLNGMPQTKLVWNDTTGSWFDLAHTYVKLAVPSDGIFRLTYAVLIASAPDAAQADPRTFRLLNRGREMPIRVVGEQDSAFNSGDLVEFVGRMNYNTLNYRALPSTTEPYRDRMDRYTDTSFYWLTWGGPRGRRVDSITTLPVATDTLNWYTQLVRFERNNSLQQIGDASNQVDMQNPLWTSNDMWGDGWLNGGSSLSFSMAVSNIYAGSPTFRVLHRTSHWGGTAPAPFRVAMRWNSGTDTVAFTDIQKNKHAIIDADVPIAKLTNGTNTMVVAAAAPPSGWSSFFYDWSEIEYPRQAVAFTDSLVLSFPKLPSRALRTIIATGFSNANVVVYRALPEPRWISAVRVAGSGTYTVSFQDTVGPGDVYYILPVTKVRTPIIKYARTFANLRSVSRGADYLLLTHPMFLARAGSYASMIGGKYGQRTAVINVMDVFDEFAFGYPMPEGIKDFLRASTSWQSPMPSFLTIVGDATYDYRYYGADPNPANRPMQAVPSFGYPASDAYYGVLTDSSIVPQLMIGRITANSDADFQRYQSKAQSYLTGGYDDWNKRFMFFSGGDANVPSQLAQFKETNDGIINTYVTKPPVGGSWAHFYKTAKPFSDLGPYTPEYIRSTIDNGALAICYIGHSAVQTWDNGIGYAEQLQNTRGRSALFCDFGCSTAKFAESNITCFGELFTVGPTGSAIAYIGNSALGFVSVATSLPPKFFKQILADTVKGIGKAHLLGKLSYIGSDTRGSSMINRVVMWTNTLLGDPAIELALPPKPNLDTRAGVTDFTPATPSDEDDSVAVRFPFFNTGLWSSDSVTVAVRHGFGGVNQDTTLRRALPLFADTARISYPVKDRAGDHTFSLSLNPAGSVGEIQNFDNTRDARIVVLSNALRLVSPLSEFDAPGAELRFANPSRPVAGSTTLTVELDSLGTFPNPQLIVQPLGTVWTRVPLPGVAPGAARWWRAGLSNSNLPKLSGRLTRSLDGSLQWSPKDSNDWKKGTFSSVRYVDGEGVKIIDRSVAFKITSGGYFDGNFGNIEMNSVNIVPNSSQGVTGHTVAVIDSSTLKVDTVVQYDTWNVPANWNALASLVKRMPYGKFLIDLVIDDGYQSLSSYPTAKDSLRAIGSLYIDSLRNWDSWAIIGRRGAARGSVTEAWRKKFGGRVIIETTMVRKVTTGSITSQDIGPVGQWLSATVSAGIPTGSAVKLGVLGIRTDGQLDTLMRDTSALAIDLSGISPIRYPRIRLRAVMTTNMQGASPVLTGWSVKALPPAELAVNYQSVFYTSDSVLEGSPESVSVDVYNLGNKQADSVMVVLTENSRGVIPVDTVVIPYIPPDSAARARFVWSSVGKRGKTLFYVQVDPLQRIQEMFKGNNTYSFATFVITDTVRPALDVTFDGVRIFDGDFVSANPVIRLRIADNNSLPFTDPANVRLAIDGRRVQLSSSTPDSLFEVKGGDPKAEVVVRPELARGDHRLSISVLGATGTDTSTAEFVFRVETVSGFYNVMNFPNPFAEETNFTFVLAGARLPEELRIRIYAISGRLIQDILVPQSGLQMGFNRVPWNGRDREGDELANGLYFYKLAYTIDGKTNEIIQKMAKIR